MGALSDTDFHFVARETRARAGLLLTADKAHLLEMRLTPIARREGFLSVQEMIATARARQDDRLLWAVVDALCVGETSFFRDRAPFAALRDKILPDLAHARGGRRLRILSAACAGGQEAYSLAIMLDEMRLGGRAIDCEIVAIDISERALEKARAGLYSQFEVQRGLPIAYLVRYFEKVGDLWRIVDRMRAAVKFQRGNLVQDLSALGQFNVILCRNVLTYFDAETRTDVIGRLVSMLAEDGCVFLGAADAIPDGDLAPAPGRTGAFVHGARQRAAA